MSTYNNDGVCHAWAHQTDDNPRGKNGNIYADGETIYSYGYHFPIATRLAGGLFLLTTASYSVTTSQHISAVSRAIPYGAKVFQVADVKPRNYSDHAANFVDYRERYQKALETAARARANKAWALEAAKKLADEANQYADKFKLRHKRIDSSVIDLDSLKTELAATQARKAKATKRAQAKARKEAAKTIERWKDGEPVQIPRGINKVYLRIRGDQIETSQSARFPVDHAARAWHVISACKKTGREWRANGEQVKLGYYTVNRVKPNGDLIAGCHYVEYSESTRIASLLNLPSDS